ncbi:MAG: PQQ-binding-like beta-propeller repeat protein, partial [Pseudomonadales bacterium]
MNRLKPMIVLVAFATLNVAALAADESQNWPAFRGPGTTGVLEGYALRTSWNADPADPNTQGVLWRTPVPGLGHSSPVVWGDRIFLCTAIVENGKASLMLGAGGKPTAADDSGQHRWVILCYNKLTGKELWRKTAHQGIPRATRHAKATQANTSVAVDGKHLITFFGSERLYCYDLDGNLQWSRDLGVINISKYGIGWGYASSPAIYQDRIALTCDDPSNPFLVVLRLSDGKELWRVSRKE